jgi:hypothetical protein
MARASDGKVRHCLMRIQCEYCMSQVSVSDQRNNMFEFVAANLPKMMASRGLNEAQAQQTLQEVYKEAALENTRSSQKIFLDASKVLHAGTGMSFFGILSAMKEQSIFFTLAFMCGGVFAGYFAEKYSRKSLALARDEANYVTSWCEEGADAKGSKEITDLAYGALHKKYGHYGLGRPTRKNAMQQKLDKGLKLVGLQRLQY